MTVTVDDVLGQPLPLGVQPHQVTDMVVVCEYIDDEGTTMLGFRRTRGHGESRHIGMLTVILDDLRNDIASNEDEDDG